MLFWFSTVNSLGAQNTCGREQGMVALALAGSHNVGILRRLWRAHNMDENANDAAAMDNLRNWRGALRWLYGRINGAWTPPSGNRRWRARTA